MTSDSSASRPVDESSVTRPSSSIARKMYGDTPVYEKRYTTGDWGRSDDVVYRRTEREVRLVESLDDSGIFSGRLGLVRIVDARPQEGLLATAEVAGAPLEESLATRFRRPGFDCRAALFLAGRWLQRLQQHRMTDSDVKPISELDPSDLTEYCRVRLESLADYGYFWPRRKMRLRLLALVSTLVDASDEHERQLVWAHADFAPGNVMWDGRVLTPIDFGMAHADRPLLDVTYFIHRLEMQRIYKPWLRWPVEEWTRAFLRGYGRPDAGLSPMYRALMARHFICRLHTYARRPPRDWTQAVHDRWVRTAVRRQLQRLVAG